MADFKVFVSYCHEDEHYLNEVATHLKPFTGRGLEIWSDRNIKGGQRWRQEIREAMEKADVAVLLITPAFLASDFIRTVEVPCFLKREHSNAVQILCVHLEPSSVHEPFDFIDGIGEQRQESLSEFQSFGSPETPLNSLDQAERQRGLVRLAERVKELMGTPRAPRAGGQPTPRPSGSRGSRIPLTVRLTVRGDQLVVSYRRRGTDIGPARSLSRSQVDRELTTMADALEKRRKHLDTFFDAHAHGHGERLFGLLFGSSEQWRHLFRELLPRDRFETPTPLAAKVDLRLESHDPVLWGLPWRLLSYDGVFLSDRGWTMAHSFGSPPRDPRTDPPQEVLILATDGDGFDAEHPQALADLIHDVWSLQPDDGTVRIARDLDACRRCFAGMQPHILLVYGRTYPPAHGLRFSDGELSWGELVSLFAPSAPPQAVYLACTDLVDDRALPLQILTEHVPLLIWRRLPELNEHVETEMITWLGRWLKGGLDPVQAVHRSSRERANLESRSLGIFAGYGDWRTQTEPLRPRRGRAKLLLDRINQKGRVHGYVSDLVDSDTRRHLGLVAYAAPGNGVDHLCGQLRAYLERMLPETVGLQRQRAPFPELRHDLRHELEESLHTMVGDDESNTSQLLRALAPKTPPGHRPVLWLDWGTFGACHNEPLMLSHVGAWMGFGNDVLARHCPDGLRIVSLIALELDPDKHSRLNTELKRLHHEHGRSNQSRIVVLPPVGQVPEDELWDFLEEHTDCKVHQQREAVQRILKATDGLFEPTIRLIDEGDQYGWHTLLGRLRREQGDETPTEDFKLL